MKKTKSQIMPLAILGVISICFAAYLAQAADKVSTNDTAVVPVPKVERPASTPFRTYDGVITSVSANSIAVMSAGTKVNAAINSNTQVFEGNTKATAKVLKVGTPVKIRAKVLGKTSLLAVSIKVIKAVTDTTPAIQ